MATQMQPVDIGDMRWSNVAPTTDGVCAAILIAMKDLHESATATVWLTQHETVFERLAELYGIAGGSNEELAKRWPQYFK